MKALVIERKELRYVAAMAAARFRPGAGAGVGPLRLTDLDPPRLPGPDWVRVRPRLSGICGSDLATIDGRASRYFEPLVSFPFVPGHEVVGEVVGNGVDAGAGGSARRVVLEPVLGHAARGEAPPFPGAAPADGHDYGHLVVGPLEPGLQTGYCHDTGGGWSEEFVAHPSQLHDVPAGFSDEDAVMIEPVASAVHAVLRGGVEAGAVVVVIGAGTMGLAAIAAIRHLTAARTVVVAARYSGQRHLAAELGADVVADSDEIRRAVRRVTGSRVMGQVLTGGADVVVDAVGSAQSLADALSVVRPRGRVVVLGMPATVTVDLTSLWHREVELVGAYTYGTESRPDGSAVHTFDLAIDLVAAADLGRLVSSTYPLDEYRDAIAHAAEAGRRDAVKIAFDLR